MTDAIADTLHAAEMELRALALGHPEAAEDFPWGHRAIKVRGKVFVFLVRDDEGLAVSMKLRESNGEARSLPFVQPTAYGLGKAGWVTARFEPGEEPPVFMLRAWIAESYRLIAPKTLARQVTG